MTMSLNNWLNYRIHQPENPISSSAIVLIHGLFGDRQNLGVLARNLQNYFTVIQLDIRNHGNSPQAATMLYSEMATDVLALLAHLKQTSIIAIGHSMGGKIVMAMTAIAPQLIEKIIVIDIAPVTYQINRHENIFSALDAVTQAGVTSRQEAAVIMRNTLTEESEIQFLLKSFDQGKWKFNLPVLKKQYNQLMGWKTIPAWPHPALFIRGSLSDYISENYRKDILTQFPQAQGQIILECGHWVHAENPAAVIRAIHRFLAIPSDK
jgi:esterase